MKLKRYIHVLTVMVVVASTVITGPVSYAVDEFEFLWPTPAIAADPVKSGFPQWISADGRYVAMSIRDKVNLNPQSWLLDRSTGQGELLESNQYFYSNTQFSEDLRYMVYWKQVAASDTRLTVKDRSNGSEVELGINTVTGINQSDSGGAYQRIISKDGAKVVFVARNFQNLPNLPNDVPHVYVYDTQTQQYTLVDNPSTPKATAAVISGNGNYVMYEKSDIETQQAGGAIYRQDLMTGQVVLVGKGSYCYGGRQILSDDGSMAAYNCRHGSKLTNMHTMETFPLESYGYVRSISDNNAAFLVENKLYLWETKESRVVSNDTDFDAVKMSGDGTKLVGTHWVFLPDGIGHTYRPVMKNVPSFDETPPTIEPHLSATPDGNGWNNAPVILTWSVTDQDSDIRQTNGCDTITVPATTGTVYTCAATSGGGTATESITVRVDTTAPIVTWQLSPAPNAAGWNNAPTTLTWDVSDPESPIANTDNCDPITITNNTTSTPYTCMATSSGGVTSKTTSVKLDNTAPTITAPTMSGGITLPFLGAIFTGNSTTINATVADSLSGVAAAEYYFDTDPGRGNGTALSITNNSATASASLVGLTGQHTLHVRSQDRAGNWSTLQSFTFRRIGQ